MQKHSGTFAELFKKYRLLSEFPTLSSFGTALGDKGFIYEDSIFSHWQKGTRLPQNRVILMEVLCIFVESRAITTLDQANAFLKSANQSELSDEELKQLPFPLANPIFQAPNEIMHFNAREDIIERIVHQEQIYGKVLFIHGPAGVGKTALAIKLVHLLKDRYRDGVLWYKVEEDNLMDILLSIARIYGEDLKSIKNFNVRTTIVRSLLSGKQTLLVLDSAELHEKIEMLLPNGTQCTTILTSQKKHLKGTITNLDIPLAPFTQKESLNLFQKVLQNNFLHCDKSTLIKLSKRVGNLPLGVHLLARQIHNNNLEVSQLSSLLAQENTFFSELYKEESNLYTAIAMTYQQLEPKLKTVLLSASIFKGKDFSVESIAYINGLPNTTTAKTLEKLVDLSLLEHSTKKRYRIHPAIQGFTRNKLNYPRSSILQLIAICIFSFFTIWWIILFYNGVSTPMNKSFGFTYCILALYGALCGIHTSKKWGGSQSLVGKALLMFSLGLLMQVFGQLAYAYYIHLLHIRIPYPSLGDIGYFGTIPFYIYGVILLARSSGINLSFRSFTTKTVALIIPVVMLTIAYFLFLQNYNFGYHNPIKILLDFGYPLGEAISISLALITFIFSRTILDGIMRSNAMLLLFALFVHFLADYSFLYNSATYSAGSFIDYLYLLSYFTMTLALLSMKSLLVNTKFTN